MKKLVIEVKNLSKRYVIGKSMKYKRFTEVLTNTVSHPIKAMREALAPKETIWALRNVSFSVDEGEVLGIIGRNGAGKSTLLKILSRITYPTEGEVILRGRVGSLLEVGTGFHPELTGRENIYLNGAVLGMKKQEIEDNFDEIVKFAEIEKFIDTPVKRYSSGMYVRLAFAVAAHLEPEILLVDEVLAVGDVQFQKKCLGKMRDVAGGGRTVLFVSHNIRAIAELCEQCILLEKGRVAEKGEAKRVISTYLYGQYEELSGEIDLTSPILRKNSLENSIFKWTKAKVINSRGASTTSIELMEPFEIELTGILKEKVEDLLVGFGFMSAYGFPLFNSHITDTDLPKSYSPGELTFRIRFDPNIIGPGMYIIGLGAMGQEIMDWIPEAFRINIEPVSSKDAKSIRSSYDGVILYPCKWSSEHSSFRTSEAT